MPTRVSLAELIDTDIPLRPDEAVAIVREICRQHAAHELRGIPNATVIRLTPDGRIAVEGPVSRDQDPVRAAAALLSELLPGFHSPTGFRVPGGLRLVLARATRAIDLPPFSGVDEFCAALDRFGDPDLSGTVARLFAAFASREAAAGAPEITISDVRRARRATGLSLEDVARGSAIPASMLRELEWGYLRNWRADDAGREDLRRYARAAGVDEDLVLSVAWPLIEAAAAEAVVVEAAPPEPREEWALVPAAPRELAVPPAPRAKERRAWIAGHRWLLALAAAVLLVVTALATGWDRATPGPAVAPPRVAAGPSPDVTGARPVPTSGTATVANEGVQRASLVRPGGEQPRRVTDRPRASISNGSRGSRGPAGQKATKGAKASPAPAPQRKSFFKRELFRIVIR